MALSARGIVNAVVKSLENNGIVSNDLYLWLFIGLFLAISEALAKLGMNYLSNRLRDEQNLSISGDIIEHVNQLAQRHFENPEFQNIMARANEKSVAYFLKFVTNAIDSITQFIQNGLYWRMRELKFKKYGTDI